MCPECIESAAVMIAGAASTVAIGWHLERSMRIGVYVFGLATIAAGVMDLIWREFEPAHQPIQAFGDQIPAREILALVAAVWLIGAGLAILWHRTAQVGALASALIYLVFAVFWMPRFYTATRVFGFRINVYVAVLSGVAQQLIVVAAAAIVYAAVAPDGSRRRRISLISRWIIGLSSINFGVVHLIGVVTRDPRGAASIPHWMPLGPWFWIALTGVAFILAGLAILSRIQDVLASRLLALMLLVFSLVLIPPVFAQPHSHIAWGSNAYNLAAAAAAWIFAESIAYRGRPVVGNKADVPVAACS